MFKVYRGYLLVPEAGMIAIHDKRLYYSTWARDSFLAEAGSQQDAEEIVDCWEEDREKGMIDA